MKSDPSAGAGQQPFVCSYCSRVIGEQQEMANHVLIDHDDELLS
jgi:hypothetical protein